MLGKRKGQEEIVGFVLIVVLVVVVLVIFLGLQLRNPKPEQRQSEIVYQFLESAMEQTTNCALSERSSYLPLDSLIRECHETGSLCFNGQDSCDYAQDSIKELLNNSFPIGSNFPYKGYEISINYFVNESGQQTNELLFNVTSGNCLNSYTGNSYWIPSFPGSLVVSAKICS